MALRYAKVIPGNISATRARKRLKQSDVVERMRALGHGDWHPQTLSRVERGDRRVLAEEIPALAFSLETNAAVLLGLPLDQDAAVDFTSGEVGARDLTMLFFGRNNGAVLWEGNKPVFGKGVSAFRGSDVDDPGWVLE